MAPLNRTSKPYGEYTETPFDFAPEGPPVYNYNSKTRTSALRPRALTFPKHLPAPKNLPFRPPPQAPAFEILDAVYDKHPHPLVGGSGLGCGGYVETGDESRTEEALKTLEQYIKDRTPYIQLTSNRLQAVCGVRNELPFDLPARRTHSTLNPSFRSLYDLPKEGFSRPANQAVDMGGIKVENSARANGRRKDSGVRFVPKIPLGLSAIDKETGKGLREFLLQNGKESGVRKRECKSISFHDFTPEMRTGRHNNVLLGHYGVEKGGRVDVYEVDLPTTQVNTDTGKEFPAIEPWLWILISRPIVSFDPTDTSTLVSDKSPSFTSPTSDAFYSPNSITDPDPPAIRIAPPNFPQPTPISWIVFAAPKAHLTTYPEARETIEQPPSKYHPGSRLLAINKRIDYDFSFSGIPLFEFSSVDLFTSTSQHTGFLSIENMGGWSENDSWKQYSEEEYQRLYSLWEDGEYSSRLGGSGENRNPTTPMPAPNRGVWWKVFYERMYEDVARWEAVKKAMGRGKCRVVVRWTDFVFEDDVVEMGAKDAMGGKQSLGTDKKAPGPGKRLTRSETKRRSSLGLGLELVDPPMGLVIGGVVGGSGLNESIKSRAAGNRDLGCGMGVGEKDKGKVRKR